MASSTIVIMSACLILIFSDLKISVKIAKYVSYVSSLALSIYLISGHPLVRERYIANCFTLIAGYKFFVVPLMIVFIAIGISCICLAVEALRSFLFSQIPLDSLMKKVTLKSKK